MNKRYFQGLLTIALVFAFQFVSGQDNSDKNDFYNTDVIQEIRISFEENNWQYLLDSFRMNGNRILIGKVDINGRSLKDVGVQYSGGYAFEPEQEQNGLKLKLNLISRGQHYQGYKTVILSNAVRDPSMVREVLGFEIARDYMIAPRANYSKVYINGSYYGLFVNLEPVDEIFLQKNFSDSKGAFFNANPYVGEDEPEGCKKGIYCSLQNDKYAKCYLHNFEMFSEYGWDHLMDLTASLSGPRSELKQKLDVDATLWMLAFNNALVNLSSYTGKISENYFLYRNQKNRFVPIIWDLNLAFGSYKNTGIGSDLTLKELQKMDPLLHLDNPSKPLIKDLLADPVNKKMYLSHIYRINKDWFISQKYIRRAQALQRLIQSAYAEDKARNRKYDYNEFRKALKSTIGNKSKIPGIEQLMNKRMGFLKKHKALNVLPPQISNVLVAKREKFEAQNIETFKINAELSKYTKRVRVFYRFDKEADYKEAYMVDDGTQGDGAKGDNVFGVILNPEGASDLEYYILAENASAANFYPKKYMFKPIKTSLKELNK